MWDSSVQNRSRVGRDPRGQRGRPPKGSSPPPDHPRWIKHTRWALLKDPDNPSGNQREVLDRLRRERSVLYRCWQLKEALRDLDRLARPQDARAHLDWWLAWACRSRIPVFVKLSQTIRANRDPILAAVELDLSNSKLEGLNSKIRLINHRATGTTRPRRSSRLSTSAAAGSPSGDPRKVRRTQLLDCFSFTEVVWPTPQEGDHMANLSGPPFWTVVLHKSRASWLPDNRATRVVAYWEEGSAREFLVANLRSVGPHLPVPRSGGLLHGHQFFLDPNHTGGWFIWGLVRRLAPFLVPPRFAVKPGVF